MATYMRGYIERNRPSLSYLEVGALKDAVLNGCKLLAPQITEMDRYEHHWHSVMRQHVQLEKVLEDVPLGVLFIQVDFVQNLSLPLSPQEGGT